MDKLKEKDNMPLWLKNEEYETNYDKDSYINKSILSIFKVLSKIKGSHNKKKLDYNKAFYEMILSFITIILLSISKNIYFSYTIIAVILIKIAFMDGNDIIKTFKVSFTAVLFSIVILIPSIIIYKSYYNFILINVKVFCISTAVSSISCKYSFNAITSALKHFKCPDLFILILDITLKYIVLLGNLSIDILNALKLRSVGVNKRKEQSLSGILGVTFIKSKEMSQEMYEAMICRGFTGEYKIKGKGIIKKYLLISLFYLFFIVAIFIYMEVIL